MKLYETINCNQRSFFMRMIFPLICKCEDKNCKLFDEEPNSNRRCQAWPPKVIIRANDYDVYILQIVNNNIIFSMYYDHVDWANPTIHEEISQKFLNIIYATEAERLGIMLPT